MHIPRQLAMVTLIILFPFCLSGCGQIVKIIGKAGKSGAVKTAAKKGLSQADDAISATLKNGTKNGIVQTTLKSSARSSTLQLLKAASSSSHRCSEKLGTVSESYNLLTPVSQVTLRLLIQKQAEIQQQLNELSNQINDPSLSDTELERIAKEIEVKKQSIDKIMLKVEKLYQELG